MQTTTMTPAVAAQLIRYVLTWYRNKAGKTQVDAGTAIEKSQPAYATFETGKYLPDPLQLRVLLEFFGRSDQVKYLRSVLLVARERNKAKSYPISALSQAELRIGLESFATSIYEYAASVVAGLWQTRETAEALISLYGLHAEGMSQETAERMVQVRMDRQRALLEREGSPPEMCMYVEEEALRRQIGGPEVHRRQLGHLLELVEQYPSLSVRVVPASVVYHAANRKEFSVLTFAGEDDLRVACTEDFHAMNHYNGEEPVQQALALLALLDGISLSQRESQGLMNEIRKE